MPTLPPITSMVADPNQDPRISPSINRTSAKFHPLLVTEIIIRTLKYCFGQMTNPNYKWDPDPVISAVDIQRVNDTQPKKDTDSPEAGNAVQKKPRILVGRGSYQIGKTGLNQSMTEGLPTHIAKGADKTKHMHLVQGSFSIIIEAHNEGTVEMLTDMVSTFISWSSVHICNTHGFNEFGMPLYIGEAALDKEDTEKFKVVINSGYIMETHYVIRKDGFKLGAINLDSEVTG